MLMPELGQMIYPAFGCAQRFPSVHASICNTFYVQWSGSKDGGAEHRVVLATTSVMLLALAGRVPAQAGEVAP